MSKCYHTLCLSGIALLTVGLTVSLNPTPLTPTPGNLLCQALAEEGHSYGADGYDEEGHDHEGRDREGYDHEGYSKDGHKRDHSYNKEHDHKNKDYSGTSGAAQSYETKPKVKQY